MTITNRLITCKILQFGNTNFTKPLTFSIILIINTLQTALQKAVFWLLKGGLSHAKRPSFARRFAVFCSPTQLPQGEASDYFCGGKTFYFIHQSKPKPPPGEVWRGCSHCPIICHRCLIIRQYAKHAFAYNFLTVSRLRFLARF